MLDLLNVADILGDFARRHPVEPTVIRKDRAKYERDIARLPWRSRYVEWDMTTFASVPAAGSGRAR